MTHNVKKHYICAMKSPEHTVFADEFANIFSKFLTVCEGIATPMVHVIFLVLWFPSECLLPNRSAGC